MVLMISQLHSGAIKGIAAATIFLLVSLLLWLNGDYIVDQFRYVNPIRYLNGTLSRDNYIDKYRFEYPTIRYINENLPLNAKILFIYIGNRGYYCERSYIFDIIGNRSMLHQILKRSNRPEEILKGLKSKGITHLLIRYDLFEPWVKSDFTITEQKLTGRFFKEHVIPAFL